MDELRRRKSRSGELEPPAHPDPPGEHLDLRRALDRVPTEARVLLALRYVNGLSYGELAKIRGISINTVKSQLQRGKGLLRTALTKGGTT